MLRDAAISLSLANLCFVRVWGKALSGAGSYFSEFKIAYGALVLDVICLAVVFYTGITLARKIRKPLVDAIARWSFFVAILTTANGIAFLTITLSGVNFSRTLGRDTAYYTGIAVSLTLISLAVVVRKRLLSVAPKLVLILLPFVVITFSQAIFKLVQNVGVVHAESAPETTPTVERKKALNRVVWIIFDEMDQRLTFGQRPSNIELPELDRLKAESLHATNAYPPAPLTYMSMPALITGRLVSKVTPLRGDELNVDFDGETQSLPWSRQSNVFSKARAAGFTSGLAGWCHPYCEVIGNSLSTCEVVKEKNNDEIGLAGSMFSQAEGLIGTVPLVQPAVMPIVQRVDYINHIVTSAERKKYTARYKRVLDSSLKLATDPNLDLVFIHSPAPHPPGIYDSATNDFSLKSRSYADNLELVDRTIGDLRKAMERTGVWEQTTVIVSADHWWRSEMWSRGPFWSPEDAKVAGQQMDHRIPFLVKLAGQHGPVQYDNAFNTVVTHNLVLALLQGQVSNPTDLASWLDRNRTISDSPYNKDELLP